MNFIEKIINNNFKKYNYFNLINENAKILPKIILRFPPEPSGYLHIGHTKSIYLNYDISNKYYGKYNLRFDDTNPKKENIKYVYNILNNLKWLKINYDNIFYTSNYFKKILYCAKALIKLNLAYIDEQTINEIKINKGTLNKPGKNSIYRKKTISESLLLFNNICNNKYYKKNICLRAKIDMKSPNLNLRDPIIFRYCKDKHYRNYNNYNFYPTYCFAHPLEDILEYITHSICTLEFEDQKPFYNWVLYNLYFIEIIKKPLSKQYEFSKLNLTYTITSKKKIKILIKKKIINNLNDQRICNISSLKKIGYDKDIIRNFLSKIHISKNDNVISIIQLENLLRNKFNLKTPRIIVIINPLLLIIYNIHKNIIINCINNIYNINYKNIKYKKFFLYRKIFIETNDFLKYPKKNFFRLFPGNLVKLKYIYIIECIGYKCNIFGKVIKLYCKHYYKKNKNNIINIRLHWINKIQKFNIKVKLFYYLFKIPYIYNKKNFLNNINKKSSQIIKKAYIESNLKYIKKYFFQFERLGYFYLNKNKKNNKILFNECISIKNNLKNKKNYY